MLIPDHSPPPYYWHLRPERRLAKSIVYRGSLSFESNIPRIVTSSNALIFSRFFFLLTLIVAQRSTLAPPPRRRLRLGTTKVN